jgi:glutathione peroxidase
MAESVYDFSAPLLNAGPAAESVSLADFRGEVLLIVNTASQCGFTPQYAGLEALYRTYKDRGFEVLGFPCNQFGGQEPGTEAAISAFCEENYGVSFPLFARIDVNGPNAHPLFRFLKRNKPGVLGIFGAGAIKWNFTKFLVDRNGRVAGRYGPSTKPEKLAKTIERQLDVLYGNRTGLGNKDGRVKESQHGN